MMIKSNIWTGRQRLRWESDSAKVGIFPNRRRGVKQRLSGALFFPKSGSNFGINMIKKKKIFHSMHGTRQNDILPHTNLTH